MFRHLDPILVLSDHRGFIIPRWVVLGKWSHWGNQSCWRVTWGQLTGCSTIGLGARIFWDLFRNAILLFHLFTLNCSYLFDKGFLQLRVLLNDTLERELSWQSSKHVVDLFFLLLFLLSFRRANNCVLLQVRLFVALVDFLAIVFVNAHSMPLFNLLL